MPSSLISVILTYPSTLRCADQHALPLCRRVAETPRWRNLYRARFRDRMGAMSRTASIGWEYGDAVREVFEELEEESVHARPLWSEVEKPPSAAINAPPVHVCMPGVAGFPLHRFTGDECIDENRLTELSRAFLIPLQTLTASAERWNRNWVEISHLAM